MAASTLTTTVDFGGLTLRANAIEVGSTKPGESGSTLSGTELAFLDGVTAGTAAASKALVLNSSSAITTGLTALTVTTVTPTTIAGTPSFSGAPTFASTSTFTGAPTFNANPVIGVGKTLDLDSTTATGSSHAATVTKYAFVYTTEALTTAAGASQAEVITLTGLVAAGDMAFVTRAGGTSSTGTPLFSAVTTTSTLTINIDNKHASAALNGTLIFNVWIVKA